MSSLYRDVSSSVYWSPYRLVGAQFKRVPTSHYPIYSSSLLRSHLQGQLPFAHDVALGAGLDLRSLPGSLQLHRPVSYLGCGCGPPVLEQPPSQLHRLGPVPSMLKRRARTQECQVVQAPVGLLSPWRSRVPTKTTGVLDMLDISRKLKTTYRKWSWKKWQPSLGAAEIICARLEPQVVQVNPVTGALASQGTGAPGKTHVFPKGPCP